MTPSPSTLQTGTTSHCLNTNFQAYQRQDFKNRRSSSEPVHDQGAAAAAVAASAIAASAFVVNRKENPITSIYSTSPSSMTSRDDDDVDGGIIGDNGGAAGGSSSGCCSIVEDRATKPSDYIGCLQNHIAASVEVSENSNTIKTKSIFFNGTTPHDVFYIFYIFVLIKTIFEMFC